MFCLIVFLSVCDSQSNRKEKGECSVELSSAAIYWLDSMILCWFADMVWSSHDNAAIIKESRGQQSE